LADDAKWYVIHTYSGYENKVASNLEKSIENRKLHHLIEDIKIPTEIVTEIKDDKRREVERKLFPGYVLVKMVMTDESWYIVRNISGVTGFVGASSKPIPLTDEEVENMGVEQKSIDVNYAEGDSVKITAGPFEDLLGTVEELNLLKDKVRVIVSMFGRDTPVELALDQVELAD
jgi:transcriptional antiterminator NusG